MTEDDARQWLNARLNVPRETWERLDQYVAMLRVEALEQNLIAESTYDCLWARHIVDCAQLALHGGPSAEDSAWVDVGAGAGLPGLVIAILTDWPVVLIENRKGRVAFLERVADTLGLNVRVVAMKVEATQLPHPAGVISARAYAPLPRLFATCAHLAGPDTLWVLPKGRSWQNELDNARTLWQGVFHVEQSVTDPESAIVVARAVRVRRDSKSRGRRK